MNLELDINAKIWNIFWFVYNVPPQFDPQFNTVSINIHLFFISHSGNNFFLLEKTVQVKMSTKIKVTLKSINNKHKNYKIKS